MNRFKAVIVSSTALAISMMSAPVFAQAAPAGFNALEEVVVTATRQSSTVNKVALSITAVTQKNLEQQGIHTAQDLAASVPALRITPPATNGLQISIRGIASSQGAATTGIYLDDTPLQRRAGAGAVNGIGVVLPQLFDLDRVEVLRGPQGTLYGGSSEGGTVRFITPTPSLTSMSGMARAEVNSVQDGGIGYEAGAAVGGPIVSDKLGFRVSLWDRHDAGYIDHVSGFTSRTLASNTNWKDAQAVQAKILWQMTDRFSITPSYYYSKTYANDADQSWQDIPQFTQVARYYSATGVATTPALARFIYPAHTYGPYNMWGPNKSGMNQCVYANALANATNDQCPAYQPQTNTVSIPTVTIDYRFDGVSLKSITSYVDQRNKGSQPMFVNSLGTANGGNPFVFNLPYMYAQYFYKTFETQWNQEFRLSSTEADGRLQWVAGLFYNNSKSQSNAYDIETANAYTLTLKGVPLTPLYGPGTPYYTDPGVYSWRNQTLLETELAAFGEASYRLTDKLKATVGLRVSQTKFQYSLAFAGPAFGYLAPDSLNGGLAGGTIKETPVTPKFGLSYQINPTDLVYITAAKGFRSGGVNNAPPAARCASDIATVGLTTTPQTFASDSVWSYEAGSKLRLLDGRAQVNSSVFFIDWKNPQTTFGLPTCGFSYVINAGEAQSKGADFQGQFRLTQNLTGNIAVAYTDAHYVKGVTGPAPTNTVFVSPGDLLAGAPWNLNLGLNYQFEVAAMPAYVRGDFRYSSSYRSGGQWPDTSYSLQSLYTSELRQLNVRAGITVSHWDVSVFADNVTNSQDVNGVSYPAGRSTGCSDPTCAVAKSFFPVNPVTLLKPRTVGISASVRY
ncbi:MAG: TonB-dependent receptor [Caulobacteraceae bacterium]|nr:TonB-dependent receptor [Caulobacteraceae bacterium]